MLVRLFEKDVYKLPCDIVIAVDPFDTEGLKDDDLLTFDKEMYDTIANMEDYENGCVWKEFIVKDDDKFISIVVLSCVKNEAIRKVVYEICAHFGNKFILTNDIFDMIDDCIKTALYQDCSYNKIK